MQIVLLPDPLLAQGEANETLPEDAIRIEHGRITRIAIAVGGVL